MSGVRAHAWPDRFATGALVLWGAVHVIGGLSLMTTGGSEGLSTLGPNAEYPAPANPGDAAGALVHFHGLNVALGGLAVLALAALWHVGWGRWALWTALSVAAALDLGLLVYLVGPGLLPICQGFPGPGLLALALAALAARGLRRPAAQPA